MEADHGVARADLLAAGARVGRYELLRRLAIGGMAELHLACATGVAGFQKIVVLKRVLPHLAADAEFVRMFLDEARLAAHLDHPNVVQVLDIGEAGGEYYYAMEYVHGRNVRELLGAAAHAGGLPLEVALTIAIGVAAALDHAHRRVDLEGRAMELVHRDVSPANVLVSYDGAVKLTDFGIAKAATRNHETLAGTMKGKIGYMSPEQCRGESVDRRSDIFSLGVVLFELTTCERLFFADNDFAVLNRVVAGRFDRPSQRVPSYPPALEQIVLAALATDREARYASADVLRRDLEAFAHDARLRLGSEPLSAWLHATFGAPPFPRVELRPPAADATELAPTLVLVEEGTTRVRVPAPQTAIAQLVAADPWVPMPVRRVARGRAAVLTLAAGVVAFGAWRLAEPPSAPSAAVTDEGVDAATPADPALAPDARAIASPAAAVPSDPGEGTAVAMPMPPATTTPAAATTPAADATPAAGTTTAPDVVVPSKRSSSRGDRRSRKSGRGAPRSSDGKPRDLDALYPEKAVEG